MPAVQMPVKRAEPGTSEERLRCNCGHTFTRDELDMRVLVEEFTFDGDLESLLAQAAEMLQQHSVIRAECPRCSCCNEEEGEIYPDPDADPEEEWMCTICLTKYDNEEDAVDCCE